MERREAGYSDLAWAFGRVWAFLLYCKEKTGGKFDRLPGLIDDLLERWVCRLNIYYDVDHSILAIALDPRCKSKPLSKVFGSQLKVWDCVKRFAVSKCLEILKAQYGNEDDAVLALQKEYIVYCWSDDETIPKECRFSPLAAWNASIKFESSSILKLVAGRLFGLIAHGSDIERLWSGGTRTMTSQRQSLVRVRMLDMLQGRQFVKNGQADIAAVRKAAKKV